MIVVVVVVVGGGGRSEALENSIVRVVFLRRENLLNRSNRK